MGKIAANIAAVALIAASIGFNTWRYPTVWRMVGNPARLSQTAQPATQQQSPGPAQSEPSGTPTMSIPLATQPPTYGAPAGKKQGDAKEVAVETKVEFPHRDEPSKPSQNESPKPDQAKSKKLPKNKPRKTGDDWKSADETPANLPTKMSMEGPKPGNQTAISPEEGAIAGQFSGGTPAVPQVKPPSADPPPGDRQLVSLSQFPLGQESTATETGLIRLPPTGQEAPVTETGFLFQFPSGILPLYPDTGKKELDCGVLRSR
jgi:hypothetical protein